MNIRITEAQRQRYDRAAAAAGISRTQFILEAADERADELSIEQNAFRLDQESFDEMVAMLDGPVVIPDGLRDLMARRPPWESVE